MDLVLGAGDAIGILHGEAPFAGWVYLSRVPRAALTPLVRDVEAATMRVIPRGNAALKLLLKYAAALGSTGRSTPELRRLAATHVQDLLAMALGATREGAEIVRDRSARPARLQLVKADILANLRSCELTVTEIARRQGVTPRYIHMLFEIEGITFSEFVLSHRLGLAHRMLSDPRHARLNISAIAYDCGFSDLSYFNRCFRRRFGATPSEVRADA